VGGKNEGEGRMKKGKLHVLIGLGDSSYAISIPEGGGKPGKFWGNLSKRWTNKWGGNRINRVKRRISEKQQWRVLRPGSIRKRKGGGLERYSEQSFERQTYELGTK